MPNTVSRKVKCLIILAGRFSLSQGHRIKIYPFIIQFSLVAQLCPTLCDPMNHRMPGLQSTTNSQSSPKPMSIESVMPSNHLILCCPLLLLPSIFPSIRVFSFLFLDFFIFIFNLVDFAGSFQMSQLFTLGGQSIGVSASTSVLPMNI